MSLDRIPDTLRFSIPADHPCLPGHFPGRPVVPGVVVLDRVFAAIEAAEAVKRAEAAPSAALGADRAAVRLPQVKFVQPLLPEQVARIELERMGDAAAPPRWRFKVLREADGVVLASGDVHAIDEADAA